MTLEKHYDDLYSKHENTFYGGRPEGVVNGILQFRNSGSVLEIGAGQGRNALFLAEHGFDVTAQDLSAVGLEKIDKISEDKGLRIHTEAGDISKLDLDRNFDVFVSTHMLHHLSRESALRVIAHMQEHTNPDGLNAITVFTQKGDFYSNNPDTENFYPEPDELKKLYADWEILEYEEVQGKVRELRANGTHMLNTIAAILARKPKKQKE